MTVELSRDQQSSPVPAAVMIVDEFDDRSEDETVIATMIERDFFVAIERRQRALTASDATHVRVRHPHRRSSYWLTVLTARWWATRGA